MTARQAAIVVAVAIGTLTLIQSADAAALGIPPRLEAWLPVITGALGLLASALPKVDLRLPKRDASTSRDEQ